MKKRILLILSVLVIMAIAVDLLAHFVFVSPVSSVQNKPIGANVSVTGSNVPTGIKAVTTSARSPFTMASLGPTVDISPGGKIQGVPITLRFKLNKRVSSQEVLLAVRKTASSQWTLMKPSAVSADGWYVDVQTDHLSFWQPLLYDLDQATKLFKSYFNGLSGDMFTQAEKPTCANESLARQDGYSIDSSAKKTLYWCFGVEEKGRVLKVVNRTPYPLEVQHPGLTVGHQDFNLDFAQLARLGSGKTTILYPFEEVDYTLDDLPPGDKAILSTAYSGYTQSLYRLEVGVMALISVVTRFGADDAGFYMLANKKGFQIVLRVMEAFLKAKDCANAMFPVPNGGKVLSGCFEPSEIMEALDWKGLLIAPFMAVGSLFEYFRSELESVIDIAGDNDKYVILLSRSNTQAVLDSYVGEWHVHHYDLTIKSDGTGMSVSDIGPCTASLSDMSTCVEYDTLRFMVNSDGSLSATLIKVWYIYTDSQAGVSNMPYPGTPAAAGIKRVGMVVFKLVLNGDHLLLQTWNSDDGTNDLCDPYAAGAAWYQCGQ